MAAVRRVRRKAIDGRRKDALQIKSIRQGLVDFLGVTTPSVAQNLVIDRITSLAMQLATLDVKVLKHGLLDERDTLHHLKLSNSMLRAIRQLGKGAAPQKRGPTIAEHLARKSAEKAAREVAA